MDFKENETQPTKSPLVHMICDSIDTDASNEKAPSAASHFLILKENNPAEKEARTLRLEIPDDMKAEFQVAFHYGIRQNKILPATIEVLAAQVGQHLRRILLSLDETKTLKAEVLTLSHFTGLTETFEVHHLEAILYAMAHGLPIFAREDLFSVQSEKNLKASIEATNLEGKELLRQLIVSGQLPDEFKPEETLVAVANLNRQNIIELIELAEKLEYYEWAYYLSAFIDLDELSPGGMDI